MSLERVCKMELEFPTKARSMWGCFLQTMDRIDDLSFSDEESQIPKRNRMTIESVDAVNYTMKQKFTEPEFFEGYKLTAVSTRIVSKVGSCIAESTVEYEKSGPEIEDLDVVDFIRRTIDDIGSRTGEWEVAELAKLKSK